MKRWFSLKNVALGALVFIAVFFLSVYLTQSSMKLVQFATGIAQWEYVIKDQTVVYYSDESEMIKLGYKREYSPDFPEFMKKAVVAVEDKRFYQHNGFDSRGILRALWSNLKSGKKSEGGSTITQQLARTIFLTQEKSYSRKIKEVFIASAIEDKYSKEGILNLYLNELYMGRGCSGMQCAAQSYFGKNVMNLNKAEITFLVAMIQSPEFYSPDSNLEGLKLRQETVLAVLVDQGILSPKEAEEIQKQKISFRKSHSNANKHPYYVAYLNEELKKIVGAQKLYQGGLKIYTTIDPRMQKSAEQALVQHIKSLGYRNITAKDGALVSIDPSNGSIKAMVGGTRFNENQINMAIASRQPGSAIKPLYYAAAMNEGLIKSNSRINNRVRDFGGYKPENFGSKAPNEVTVREALLKSYNVASVEILNKLGLNKAETYLNKMGITLKTEDKNLALALGGMTQGISPLKMAGAYGIFAAKGKYNPPYHINRIIDEHGNTIYSADSKSQTVIKNKTVQAMDAILQDVVRYGTAGNARIAVASGGKTGTTTNSKDLWYLGYTSKLVTAIWVGNSDGKAVTGYSTFGGSVAAPIWRDYMNSLLYSGVFPDVYMPKSDKSEQEETEDGKNDSDLEKELEETETDNETEIEDDIEDNDDIGDTEDTIEPPSRNDSNEDENGNNNAEENETNQPSDEPVSGNVQPNSENDISPDSVLNTQPSTVN